MRSAQLILVAAGVLLAGCGDSGSKTDQAQGAAQSDTMAGMDMGGHSGMGSMGMMPAMRAHMDSMAQASPEQVRSMMAMHQEMGSRMLDAMGSDMRSMNMTSDPAWTALSDSVRSDLAEIPRLSGAALKQRVQGHVGRMRGLMKRHEDMMADMQPK